MKNWRPLTLLNCDYKIIAKILPERLKIVLHKIIHTDQQKAFDRVEWEWMDFVLEKFEFWR